MKVRLFNRKTVMKPMMAAVLTIGASTLLFQGLTQTIAASEIGKVDSVPTTYTSYEAAVSAPASLPEGYKKANYLVGDINLEYYHKTKPGSMDMAKEEAAEIGAKLLWQVFALDLEGLTIEMGFRTATESFPRTNWHGDVRIDGKVRYTFTVDSVTGEPLDAVQSRTLAEKVSTGFDAALDKNPQEYLALAKEVAEKLNIVHGPIQSVQYNGQGYSDNDPSLSVDVTGENGEIALLDFSRYDKTLLGIGYSASYKSTLEYNKKLMKQLEEYTNKMREQQKSDPSTDENEPVLIPVEL
jgi:hypothetical protein